MGFDHNVVVEDAGRMAIMARIKYSIVDDGDNDDDRDDGSIDDDDNI